MRINNYSNPGKKVLPVTSKSIRAIVVWIIAVITFPTAFYCSTQPVTPTNTNATTATTAGKKDGVVYWTPPDFSSITDPKQKEQIAYGKALIAHTAKYFGPNGSVAKISNGMNCQNCHLQAGTVVFGNNFGSVASMYPAFRARSGTIENVYKRVNDCFIRSLNGKAIDTAGKQMQAIVAYINLLGTNVEKGKKAAGSGLKDIAFLDRAADPGKGGKLYAAKCQSCHQANGEGLFNGEKSEYIYPPLWGKHSFNDAAGLYRLSNLAKFVKYNMPVGVTHQNPQLTDEEAWDIGAFIIAQERPHMDVSKDWPDITKKPFDAAVGPYADSFSERQHKFGPFKKIVAAAGKSSNSKKG